MNRKQSILIFRFRGLVVTSGYQLIKQIKFRARVHFENPEIRMQQRVDYESSS